MLLVFTDDSASVVQSNMKTVIVVLLVFTLTFTDAAINCPSSWTKYKTVEEVSYQHSVSRENEVIVNRLVMYQCSEENDIKFNTTWSVQYNSTENFGGFRLQLDDISKYCLNENCTDIVLKIRVNYQPRFWYRDAGWSDWTFWKTTGENSYLKKNCDKLYWTNWIATSTCETSSHIMRKRTCMDCDGDALEQIYCDATGDAVAKKNCNHYWGDWTKGHCVTTGCNTEGERVVIRQCLYDDGREANKVQMCSASNESAIMKEKCINNTIPVECLSQTSPDTGVADNIGFYIGIGVAVALIVILCTLLTITRCRRHKPGHFPPTVIANPTVSSTCSSTNSTKKTNEQSDNNASQPTEINQLNPNDAYQFAKPTTSANDRSFKGLNQAEQNKLKNEPVTSDGKQIDGSNAYKFEQASDQNVYVIDTPDASNVYDIATSGDPNVYKVEDRFQHADLNLPMAHSFEDEQEHSNTYSSLQSSNDVVESMYSILER